MSPSKIRYDFLSVNLELKRFAVNAGRLVKVVFPVALFPQFINTFQKHANGEFELGSALFVLTVVSLLLWFCCSIALLLVSTSTHRLSMEFDGRCSIKGSEFSRMSLEERARMEMTDLLDRASKKKYQMFAVMTTALCVLVANALFLFKGESVFSLLSLGGVIGLVIVWVCVRFVSAGLDCEINEKRERFDSELSMMDTVKE